MSLKTKTGLKSHSQKPVAKADKVVSTSQAQRKQSNANILSGGMPFVLPTKDLAHKVSAINQQ